jgi:hypothetical protein
MLTNIKQQPIVATTRSISGSLRTAKICALHELRVWFDSTIHIQGGGGGGGRRKKKDTSGCSSTGDSSSISIMEDKLYALLEEQMERVRKLM